MPPGPRAVVIPFGVPAEGRGLGLGLAALVHSFTQIEGQSVALAQLLAKKEREPADGGPVEAFVPPHAWRDLAGAHAPPDVAVVLTGALEPPLEGRGLIQLLAFHPQSGATHARVELHLDATRAGRTLVTAFGEIWSKIGGELGTVKDIGDLPWDALESVLRGERCFLHDPTRNGPHDRLAAMLHMGRAVGDAPEARFPAGRLAAIALETAMSASSHDARLADAALRALTRAAEDAPSQVELLEAAAALHVRIGNAAEAESRALSALEQAPDRGRLYAILSEARRALGNLAGALAAVDLGLGKIHDDPVLLTERGVILAEQGDLPMAEATWRSVLKREPLNPPAFANLASLAMRRPDPVLAQWLVDAALSARVAHPDVLRRAIHLALSTETDGVARSARVAALSTALLGRTPLDAWACLMLARATLRMGDRDKAAEQLLRVQALAPDSAFAAEAQRGRFALLDPQAALDVDAVVRAAPTSSMAELELLAVRARRLAGLHSVWTAWYALGVVERLRGRWGYAREALEQAASLSKGATVVQSELVAVFIAQNEPRAALAAAERLCRLEGHGARSLGLLASALFADGQRKEAENAIVQALRYDPDDAQNRSLLDRIRAEPTNGRRGSLLSRFWRPRDRGKG